MKLAIIGDYNEGFKPHKATNEAIAHFIARFNVPLEYDWIPTDSIDSAFSDIVSAYRGFWIAPGSPYKNMSAALRVIRYAREHNIPVFGTCGGFQHMVIEFARNVLGITDAEHAEYDPYASRLVVNPLSCSLAGQALDIDLTDKSSRVFNICGSDKIREKYYCNFGLNPEYEDQLHRNGFRVVGTDNRKEARILELENHIFFIATLFVPQDNSTLENPNKLVTAFLNEVANNNDKHIPPVNQIKNL